MCGAGTARASADADDDTIAGVDHAYPDGSLPGCGVGGSSRQISRRFGTSMTGISLSPVQVSSDVFCPTSWYIRTSIVLVCLSLSFL